MTSTLDLNGLSVDNTSTIECYDSTIGISDTMMLYVVGMYSFCLLDIRNRPNQVNNQSELVI